MGIMAACCLCNHPREWTCDPRRWYYLGNGVRLQIDTRRLNTVLFVILVSLLLFFTYVVVKTYKSESLKALEDMVEQIHEERLEEKHYHETGIASAKIQIREHYELENTVGVFAITAGGLHIATQYVLGWEALGMSFGMMTMVYFLWWAYSKICGLKLDPVAGDMV